MSPLKSIIKGGYTSFKNRAAHTV